MTTAYFTPGPGLREKLMNAARRRVDVQVSIPRYSNHPLVDWASRPYIGELLEAGVRIFAYKDFMGHAKTATVDGAWSTVGSANIDTLSLFGLHETKLDIYSGRVAKRLEAMFELDRTKAEESTPEGWRGRPLPVKVQEQAFKKRPFTLVDDRVAGVGLFQCREPVGPFLAHLVTSSAAVSSRAGRASC